MFNKKIIFMKKIHFFLLQFLFIAANANAQLRVDSIGQVYARCYNI